jgi:DNA-binding response OmpR family regulator
MKIGILDDNPAVCGVLRELLEFTGHEVFVHNNPWDLLMFLFSCDPPTHLCDAMIIDLLLPELSGSQVIRQIQEHFIDLPIIVISALPDVALDAIHTKFPTVAVLKKPFTLKDLLAILESIRNSAQELSPPVS